MPDYRLKKTFFGDAIRVKATRGILAVNHRNRLGFWPKGSQNKLILYLMKAEYSERVIVLGV
jgi:hypothetical protein